MTKRKRSRKRSSASRNRRSSPRRGRATGAQQTTQTAVSTKAAGVDFRSEYQYVLSDLKRFGILAAAMFATLLVLALVIR